MVATATVPTSGRGRPVSSAKNGSVNGGYRNGCVAPGGEVNALARYGRLAGLPAFRRPERDLEVDREAGRDQDGADQRLDDQDRQEHDECADQEASRPGHRRNTSRRPGPGRRPLGP